MQIREQQVWEEAGESAFPQLPGNPDAPASEAAGGGRREAGGGGREAGGGGRAQSGWRARRAGTPQNLPPWLHC